MVSDLAMPLMSLSAELAERLAPKRIRTIIEWAEDEYRLPESHTVHGLVRFDNSPFWLEPLLALTDGITEQVTALAGTQTGKPTILGNSYLGWCICENPGTFLCALPRKEDFSKRMDEDIRKTLLASSETIQKHVPSSECILRDGVQFDNMRYKLAAVGSAEELSGLRVPHAMADECKGFSKGTGKMGHPIELLRDRGRTYQELGLFRMLIVSSPGQAGDVIEAEFEAGDRCEYWNPCPHCNQYQWMTWDCVLLDKTRDGKILHHSEYARGGHARYVCPHCGAEWTERERFASVQRGLFRPQAAAYTDDQRAIPMSDEVFLKRIKIWERFRAAPKHTKALRGTAYDRLQDELLSNHSAAFRSFRVPAWLVSPVFTTIDSIATRFASAMEELIHRRDPEKLQAWKNNECAETYRIEEKQFSEMALRRHTFDGVFQCVPKAVRVLVCGVDVQATGFYTVVFGFSPDWEGWLIQARYFESGRTENNVFTPGETTDPRNYEPLLGLINAVWPHEDGKPIGLSVTGLDSGDGTRTFQIYDFCNRVNAPERLVPLKGDAAIVRPPYIMAKDLNAPDLVERRRKRRRQLRYNRGQTLYRFSPLYYKSLLWQWTQPEIQPGPGYLWFPKDVSVKFEEQFCSQYLGRDPKTKRQEWRNRAGRSANHYNDAAAMAVVCADLAGVGNLRDTPPAARKLREMVIRE